MAPPRQRTAAVVDDSRSEASSGPREHKTTTGKGRKAANGSLPTSAASNRDMKASGNAAGVTSAPAGRGDSSEGLPKIPWSQMPVDLLHSYRHAYNLPGPSAFSSEYSHLLLSKGIGLRSPTAIAAQRAQMPSAQNGEPNGTGSAASASSSRPASASKKGLDSKNGTAAAATTNGVAISRTSSSARRRAARGAEERANNSLHQIIAQGRIGKNQLAVTVRRHFNNASLPEQEAIARFLYKVREEGRGRQFRLRFQP